MKCQDKAAVYMDRDGTIIEEQAYPKEPNLVRLLPNTGRALRTMEEKGYLLFVVSNQSGVGRGIITDEQFKAVHNRCCELLQQEKIHIAEFAYCFHRPDENCGCRKPMTGLVAKTFNGNKIDWSRSFMVGDKRSDLELADKMGAPGYLVLTGYGPDTAEELRANGSDRKYVICDDLLSVAEKIPSCRS